MFFTAACDVSKVKELVYTQFNGQTYPDNIKKKGELETLEETSLKYFNRYFLGPCKHSELCAKDGRLVKTRLKRPILIKVRDILNLIWLAFGGSRLNMSSFSHLRLLRARKDVLHVSSFIPLTCMVTFNSVAQ